MQIILQPVTLFEFAIGDFENVDAPADPGLRLGFRHIQQIGECAGLQRQRKLIHNLNLVAVQRGGEQFVNQSFEARDKRGIFWALKKRLGDFPVISVLGWISLDGQLPRCAHRLFRGDRHAERRVGTEGLPILRRAPHVFMAQNHRDVFAVKWAFENTGFLTGITEWIGQRLLVMVGCGGHNVAVFQRSKSHSIIASSPDDIRCGHICSRPAS